jgi:NAD(P)H-dependent FMN reductase
VTDNPQPGGEPVRLAIIIGSTRTVRFGPVVARWFEGQARARDDMAVDVIDLADHDIPAVFPSGADPAVAAFTRRIAPADAFVVVTPEYNHGYPASLKQAIDVAYHEWRAKPVGFVSYGGMSGGLRAVEQLRLVFAELHATTVRDCVSFHLARSAFDEAGDPVEPVGCEAAAKTLLDQLAWWALALREARAARPYGA